MNIEYVGNDAIVDTGQVAFTYSINNMPRDLYREREDSSPLNFNNNYMLIGGFKVHPYGNNDDLPEEIRDVMIRNYIAPGLLTKKTQLLWGLGPKPYTETIVDNVVVKNWIDNSKLPSEIVDWLDSWDYENYLLKCATDYGVMQSHMTKLHPNTGFNKIARLEHVYISKGRLASKAELNTLKPTHLIQSDYPFGDNSVDNTLKAYPLFERGMALDKTYAIYSNTYTFCTDYYTIPDIYGSLEWLKRSTSVPLIFRALSKNSMNLKYHIISPEAFWDAKRNLIKDNCTKLGKEYKEQMLIDYQNEFLRKMAVVLSGEENTGKYLHTTKNFTVEGTNLIEHGWEIKVIDQNVKDFVEAQIKISQRADHALSSGIGLHAALGNVSETGKSDSGSEQIYALKNYLATGVDIPEMIVTKAINIALKVNFPKANIKIGFFHQVAEKEQDVSPKDRLINKV
nr:hypothetical protein [uncultured Flavobacterium sp.]